MRVADKTETFNTAGTVTGTAFGLDHMIYYSLTAVSTGTAVGTIKLQASNDAFTDNVNNNEKTTATWVDITSSTQAVAGTGTKLLWTTGDAAGYRAVRAVYTTTSGTGNVVLYWHAKGGQS